MIFNCITEGELAYYLEPKQYLIINIPICLVQYKNHNHYELNQYFKDSTLDYDKHDIRFPLENYEKISVKEINNYFIEVIMKGLNFVRGKIELPFTAFETGIKEFSDNGYRNKWIVGPRKIQKTKVICQVLCEITIANFLATFEVIENNKTIYSEIICCTLPDERNFLGKCKRLIVKDGVAYAYDVSSNFKLQRYSKNLRELIS